MNSRAIKLAHSWPLALCLGTFGCQGEDSGPNYSTSQGTGQLDEGSSEDSDSNGDSGPMLDVAPADTSDSGAADGGDDGCQKVDFIFIIDNSGSMEDEQANLIASFPGFMSHIEETLEANDYHVMVVDSDAGTWPYENFGCDDDGNCTCVVDPGCCTSLCYGPWGMNSCNGEWCDAYTEPSACELQLGAGKVRDGNFSDCGVSSGQNFLDKNQEDLADTFSCIANVGVDGNFDEQPMESMVRALTTMSNQGECNEGFLRDDAILVAVFLTDEEALGSASTWKSVLSTVKGTEESVVMLGLLGDPDVDGGLCTEDEADPSPNLRAFAESFTYGQWGSICAPDYTPWFIDAVSTIDTACDEFIPPD